MMRKTALVVHALMTHIACIQVVRPGAALGLRTFKEWDSSALSVGRSLASMSGSQSPTVARYSCTMRYFP